MEPKNKDYIIGGQRLLDLLNAERRLRDLEDAGVDNWEGYGEGFGPELEAVPHYFHCIASR